PEPKRPAQFDGHHTVFESKLIPAGPYAALASCPLMVDSQWTTASMCSRTHDSQNRGCNAAFHIAGQMPTCQNTSKAAHNASRQTVNLHNGPWMLLDGLQGLTEPEYSE
ncbi:hypothetical protein AAER40_27875, partial [Klebsiella pneumoniae]|uniref:hypothetical protein n=1 Tax=Klebsiella pneumoniae TaxID=573 RepID=UPI0031352452